MPFSYENYDDICSTYGDMRRPVGHNKQLQFFSANLGCPALDDQDLLDAGCGTGNYMAVYMHRFKSIRCLDFSDGMLGAAKAKLERAITNGADASIASRVTFEKGDVSNLTNVPSASVDAVCCNQVVHHLRADDDHADMRRMAQEFFRVLRSNGRACINYTAPETQLYSTWWSELIPDAVQTWAKRAATLDALERALREAGFAAVSSEMIPDVMYDKELYYDLDSFASDVKRYARAESTFSLSSPEELERAAAKVRKLKADGTLDAWFSGREKVRMEFGQSYNVYAVKES